MPLRTTSDDMRALLQDESIDAFIFIQVASDIVDTYLMASGLSSTMLARIESFLACHFYLLSSQELVREEYDNSRFQYVQAKVGEGFAATKWGQMAMALDSTGTLRGSIKTRAALYIL